MVPSHGIAKNSRQIYKNKSTGRSFVGKNAKAKKIENYLIDQFIKHKTGPTFEGKVWAIFLFHFENFHTKKGPMSLRLGDLSNLYQMPEDCLQKAGIIKDDALIMAHDYSRKLPGKNNELEVFLFDYDSINADS